MVHPGVGRIVKYHPLYPIVSYCIFWVLCMNQQQQEADEEEQEEKEEEEEESSVAGGWLNVRGCQWTTSHTILVLYYILYWYYTNGYGTLSECAVPVSETVCVRCNVSSGVLILGVYNTLLSLTVLYSKQYCVQYMLSVQCWVYNICWVLRKTKLNSRAPPVTPDTLTRRTSAAKKLKSIIRNHCSKCVPNFSCWYIELSSVWSETLRDHSGRAGHQLCHGNWCQPALLSVERGVGTISQKCPEHKIVGTIQTCVRLFLKKYSVGWWKVIHIKWIA